jgi:hypothetical protein
VTLSSRIGAAVSAAVPGPRCHASASDRSSCPSPARPSLPPYLRIDCRSVQRRSGTCARSKLRQPALRRAFQVTGVMARLVTVTNLNGRLCSVWHIGLFEGSWVHHTRGYLRGSLSRLATLFFLWSPSSRNDGAAVHTAQTARDLPLRAAGSHHFVTLMGFGFKVLAEKPSTYQ